ncbi:hypothetical protein [Trichlorobacter lovleyi]|uniref:hypothetical protein n=1 Tax=Trichlorobacter lovleyi TaxID=313985 RepID=UPI003D0C97B6
MNRWAPINVLLLQFLKPGVLHSKVDAALVLTVDRMNGVEKSAREYARQWGWSADKVIRFMEDPKSHINLSRDSDATPETSIDGDSQPVTRQHRDKTLAKASATEARQQRDSGATPETSIDGDSQPVTRQQHDSDATTTRRLFIKGKEKKEEPCPSDSSKALFDLWNETAEGTPLSKVREFSSTRQKKCSARLKERPLDEWATLFRRIAATPFLCGQNDRGWKADFDWIIVNDDNAAKVLEGKYDRSASTSRPPDSRYSEIFAGA